MSLTVHPFRQVLASVEYLALVRLGSVFLVSISLKRRLYFCDLIAHLFNWQLIMDQPVKFDGKSMFIPFVRTVFIAAANEGPALLAGALE